jgi:hypothetical protein
MQAGVRISYAQLLAAAHSMVLDADVWGQAAEQVDMETDIPEVAIAICCDGVPVSLPWVRFPVRASSKRQRLHNTATCLKQAAHKTMLASYLMMLHSP